MNGTLVEITLGRRSRTRSFNNDSLTNRVAASFRKSLRPFRSYQKSGKRVPGRFLHSNAHTFDSDQIHIEDDKIVVGEYCNHGVVAPRNNSIIFSRLFNCTPLVSLIRGDEDYISFLHTWAIYGDPKVVDKQVKHWMGVVSEYGDVCETVFAPRKKKRSTWTDTVYETAIDEILRVSQKTIVLARDLNEIKGIANERGVYFEKCGYHLWES